MINYIYRLVSPRYFSICYKNVSFLKGVLVRPEFMSICHADQRYYQGKRKNEVLKKKLPMALIHECCGFVVKDFTNTFNKGQKVVLIPNLPKNNGDNSSQIYENYRKGAVFCSSGYDGFMQELVFANPDRLVPYNLEYGSFVSITELISVVIHCINRFLFFSHKKREKIAIFGDGNVSYLLSLTIKEIMPKCKVVVVGKHAEKLSIFSFVDETYTLNDLPAKFEFDHAFECVGNNGSIEAIDKIIKFILPQGTLNLLGVSEEKILLNSRSILEKGLTLIGCSRSGRKDFIEAVNLLSSNKFRNKVNSIINEAGTVRNISDIHHVFSKDLNTNFKTTFKWDV